jgi:hypothetical protein
MRLSAGPIGPGIRSNGTFLAKIAPKQVASTAQPGDGHFQSVDHSNRDPLLASQLNKLDF